jgi:hypothetical protein
MELKEKTTMTAEDIITIMLLAAGLFCVFFGREADADALLLPEELVRCEEDFVKYDHLDQMNIENDGWDWVAVGPDIPFGTVQCNIVVIDGIVADYNPLVWCGGDPITQPSLDRMIIENSWPSAEATSDFFVGISWCSVISVPEPSTRLSLLAGVGVLVALARRRDEVL